MKNIILVISVILVLVSCGATSNSASSGSQPSLANTKWQLADNVKGKLPTLVLETDRVSGNAGCNNYFGALLLNANAASFSAKNLGSTKMACEDMATESNFLNLLPKANKYKVNDDTLELYENSLLLLKFNKIP